MLRPDARGGYAAAGTLMLMCADMRPVAPKGRKPNAAYRMREHPTA